MRWFGHRRVELDECGSTNDEAAALARDGAAHGTIVIARRQTAGRGRDGRTWVSPPGGLYLSAILRPALPLPDVPPLTLAIGVGVCDAARAHGAAAELKWPNDIYVASKKLAGILVEAQSQGSRLLAVIAGIGVNLGAAPDLPADPTSHPSAVLRAPVKPVLATALAADRAAFVTSLCEHAERWIDRYLASGLAAIAPAWRERMMQGLALVAGDITGELAGLADDGALLLRDAAGRVHRIRSGDVAVSPRGT